MLVVISLHKVLQQCSLQDLLSTSRLSAMQVEIRSLPVNLGRLLGLSRHQISIQKPLPILHAGDGCWSSLLYPYWQ